MVTIEGYETIIYTEDDLATSFKGNKMNEWTNEPEAPKIKKSKSTLTNPHYDTPQTSPLIFHFEPDHFPSSEDRLRKIQIQHASIEGKSVYVFDDFFSQEEAQEIRAFSKNASFSRNSYGSPEAIKQGEAPARSMNGKERWQSIIPLEPFTHFINCYTFGREMDAEISTLPWELCDTASNGSPSVIGNFLERASSESMDLGRHKDCNPEEGIAFGIPILYSSEKSFYENRFENGSRGHPWIISIMLYSTTEITAPNIAWGRPFRKTTHRLAHRMSELPFSPIRHRPRAQHRRVENPRSDPNLARLLRLQTRAQSQKGRRLLKGAVLRMDEGIFPRPQRCPIGKRQAPLKISNGQ